MAVASRARYRDSVDPTDPTEGFLEVASGALFEVLLLRGYPLWLLADPDELVAVGAADDAFQGFRRYPRRPWRPSPGQRETT